MFSIKVLSYALNILYISAQLIKILIIIFISKLIEGTLFNITKKGPYSNNKNMKFILIWTQPVHWDVISPFNEIPCNLESRPFREQSCQHQNCYYTNNRSLLNSVADYPALLFYGVKVNDAQLPKKRKNFQYYVFAMNEPASYYAMESRGFNNLFNLTMTHRLNSEIPWPYFYVIDKTDNNTVVGPRINMKWKESPKILTKEYLSKLYGKTELAAWFVSNCNSKNNRTLFGYTLMNMIIEKSNLTIDVYGRCSYYKCPSRNLPTKEDCNQMLGDNYLFYFAFENSNEEDYVTEKVMRAMQNDLVPVVYGGANYSRFLPPGSYIDAKNLGPRYTALVMLYLYSNREAYSKFFYWKNTYEYKENILGFSCELCGILNSNSKITRTYPNFTDWWNVERSETID